MKTKMKWMLLALMVCMVGTVHAQENNDGIQFAENMTFDQALALAKKENKLLFIDCYTSWCGPCKMMARDIFPQKIVGDYFNPKFVSLKVDMEKGEGVQLKTKFEIKAFPTFVILNGNGEIISRLVGGGGKAEDFIKRIENSLSEKGLLALQKRYKAGERSTEFLGDYIKALREAYLSDECAKVTEEMLTGKEAELLQNEMLFEAFTDHIDSPESSSFQYVLNHKKEFIEKYGEQKINMKLNRVWSSYPNSFVKKSAEGATFDEAKMKEYIVMMEKNGVENAKEITALTYIRAAEVMANWKQYVTLCTDFQKNFKAEDMYVYNWARRVEMSVKDADLRQVAASWIEKRVKELEEEVAKNPNPDPNAAISMVGGPTWIKPYKELLTKLKS